MPLTTFSSYTGNVASTVLVAVKRDPAVPEQVLDGEPQRVPDAVSGVLSALEGGFAERHEVPPAASQKLEHPSVDSCSQGTCPFHFFLPERPSQKFSYPPGSADGHGVFVLIFRYSRVSSPEAKSPRALYLGQHGPRPWTTSRVRIDHTRGCPPPSTRTSAGCTPERRRPEQRLRVVATMCTGPTSTSSSDCPSLSDPASRTAPRSA